LSPADATRGRWLLAFLAVFSPLAVFRTLLIFERLDAAGLVDLRGFASDAAVSVAVVGVCIFAARASVVLAALLGVLWVLMQGANYETISALGTPASLADAHFLLSPTFLAGSATTVTHPAVALLLLVATPLLLVRALRAAPRLAWRAGLGSLVASGLAFGLLSFAPLPFDAAGWRLAHALELDARLSWRHRADAEAERQARGPMFRDAATAMLDLVPEMAADFSGEPRVPFDGSSRHPPNVLLVVLESVSGSHIDRLAAAQERPRLGLMPKLDAIAGEGLAYASFFAHQRKTNRGLYALLCGELPNLRTGLPKMSSYHEGGRQCLPEILARAGYRTRYLQAAPLAFMLKDRFMPRAGFARVDGGDFFREAYARSAWGVDDRAFFEGAARVVEQLEANEEKPWFLTLLTVGTHHPFVVPHGFEPKGVQTEVERTLRYADLAVGAFDRRLRELGVFDDTLVLYTSDESLGPTRTATRIDRLLGQNWGYLVARVPGAAPELVGESFAQIDVAASILDYVGLSARAGHLFGRSVFRRYSVGRYVFFANANAYFNGVYDPYGRLALCMLDFESCRVFRPTPGRPFSPHRREVEWDETRDGVLREMTRRSLNPDESLPGVREYALLGENVFLADRRVFEVVHGGQYLALEPGDWVETELVVRAEGAPGGGAEIRHRVETREQGVLYEEVLSCAVGETLRIRHRFGAAEAVNGFGVRSYARTVDGRPIRLVFEAARVTLHRGQGSIEPGFHLEPPERTRQKPAAEE